MTGSRLRPRIRHQSQPHNRRSIYVSTEAEAIWEKAAKFAEKHNVSLSSVVEDALYKYFKEV